jgi:MoxR-like ATPase
MPEQDLSDVKDRISTESAFVDDLLSEMGRVVVGQRYMIERLLIGLLASHIRPELVRIWMTMH